MTIDKKQENENMIYDLLAKYLSGESTEDEQEKLGKLIGGNPAYERMIEEMDQVWQMREKNYNSSNIADLWKQVSEKTGIAEDSKAKPLSKRIRFPFQFNPAYSRIFAYAALFLFVVVLPFLYIYNTGDVSSELNTLIVARMEQSKINLSDGTLITLDAGSILRYPDEFNGDTREVFLEGEGYFEVRSDRNKPFIVHTNHALVEVVGTKFNVRAWKLNSSVDVTVAEGKVSLERKMRNASGSKVLITAGQLSSLSKDGLPSQPYEVNVKNRLAWMKFEMNFEDKPFTEVLHQLERWYDLSFEYSDPSILDEHVTIHLNKRSVDEILDLLGSLVDSEIERVGKKVSFKSIDTIEEQM